MEEKVIGILLVFVATLVPSILGGGEYVLEAENKCLLSFPSITREFVDNVKHTKTLPENPTKDWKCYMACVGKEILAAWLYCRIVITHIQADRMINPAGDMDADVLKQVTVDITGGSLSHDDAHEMVTKCTIDLDEPDVCEMAQKYVSCKIEELKEHKFDKSFCPGCNYDK